MANFVNNHTTWMEFMIKKLLIPLLKACRQDRIPLYNYNSLCKDSTMNYSDNS